MKNSNIVVSLDTRRQKTDGTYPLVMRLGHNERTTAIPLGISLLRKDWDDQNKVVRKSYIGVTSVARLNNLIQKKKSDALDVIFRLHESGELGGLAVTDIRSRIENIDKQGSFFQYSNTIVDELLASKRIGTARSYKGVISVLKAYHGEKELSFKEINYSFLTKFEIHHKAKGNDANGLAVYMRTIRAIYNKAMKAGLVNKDLYPFNDYKIKTTPTEKRALEWNFIKQIIELKLEPRHICFNARNYFLASYMMYGMNFSDMAHLKKADIANGRINYRRRKTSKLYDIKVTENLNSILTHYMTANPSSEYVFPIVKRNTPQEQEKDIQWARKRYNTKLKVLGRLCGIDHNLTSYVSRHSFATQAMLQQVPLNAISTMLGHSSLKTTEIYLKSLPSNILDDYNARLMG